MCAIRGCTLKWSASVLERVTAEGRAGREGLSKLAFLVMGVMATLAALFKQGHRCACVSISAPFSCCLRLALSASERLRPWLFVYASAALAFPCICKVAKVDMCDGLLGGFGRGTAPGTRKYFSRVDPLLVSNGHQLLVIASHNRRLKLQEVLLWLEQTNCASKVWCGQDLFATRATMHAHEYPSCPW